MKHRSPSLFRRGVSVALLCVLIAVFLLPLVRTEAEAASNYRVRHWHDTFSEDYRVDYYRVYKSKSEGEPTFYRSSEDVYTNVYSGQDIRITLYRSIDASDKKADAFVEYLRKNSKYKHCYANWYRYDMDGWKDYYAYTVEGYNLDKSDLNLEKLLERNPFENANGLTMYLMFIDQGNVMQEDWDLIWYDMSCSVAMVLYPKHFPKGLTFGLRFEDWTYPDGIVRRYCPYET